MQQCCRRPSPQKAPAVSPRPLASPRSLAWRERLLQNAPCDMTSAQRHCDPPPAMAGPMPTDQHPQATRPLLQRLQTQDAQLQAMREELQACRMAIQAEALERSNAVAQAERVCRAHIVVETKERTESIGAVHADLRVVHAQLHDLLTALEKERKEAKWQSGISPPHQAKLSHPTQEHTALMQRAAGPAIATPIPTAEVTTKAEAETGAHRGVPGSEERESVKIPQVPSNEPWPAATRAELLDELNNLKGDLKTQLTDMQQGLGHALDRERSERRQFENRNTQSFETLKESVQVLFAEVQEDLAKRAPERAQAQRPVPVQPLQELTSLEDRARGRADGAAGARRGLGIVEAPNSAGTLDFSDITPSLPVLSETDISLLAQSGGLTARQGQVPSRYLLRCTATPEPSPRLGTVA